MAPKADSGDDFTEYDDVPVNPNAPDRVEEARKAQALANEDDEVEVAVDEIDEESFAEPPEGYVPYWGSPDQTLHAANAEEAEELEFEAADNGGIDADDEDDEGLQDGGILDPDEYSPDVIGTIERDDEEGPVELGAPRKPRNLRSMRAEMSGVGGDDVAHLTLRELLG